MNHYRLLPRVSVLLLALLAVNPLVQAANRKARPAPKEHAAKEAQPSPQETYQKHVEEQIANLKDDVYTRATWKKLQEVKQEADDTAGNMKLAMFSAAVVGFVFGCVVTFIFARRRGGAEENLKIT